MKNPHAHRPEDLVCPSAQPQMRDSVIFGVIGGNAASPQVAYLDRTLPVTNETLSLAAPVQPTEVFRFSAPCAAGFCQHFHNGTCRLIARTVQLMPEVVAKLPPCRIRASCRWWRQEGSAACKRCPQVVTESYFGTEAQRAAATPERRPEDLS